MYDAFVLLESSSLLVIRAMKDNLLPVFVRSALNSWSEGAEGMAEAAHSLNWALWWVPWGDPAGMWQGEGQITTLACPQLYSGLQGLMVMLELI